MIHIFVDPAQTEVVQAAKDYFTAVAWCYPFLGSIFLYRNALQGLGYGLVPMMGGVFELVARALVVMITVRLELGYMATCASDPAAWMAALIPLVPYYIHVMKKIKT
jgi:Na+-driven multidrug efflux pump